MNTDVLSADHPRVFISYSRDSAPHMKKVVDLATQLRNEGVDCIIDEYVPAPVQGWQQWMIDEITSADFVLVVCSKEYLDKVTRQAGSGGGLGVAWEGAVVIQDLYQAGGHNAKYIPVVLSSDDLEFIPQPLRATTYYDLSREDGYEKLYRRLTNQPETPKPPLGAIRVLAANTPLKGLAGLQQHASVELITALIEGEWGAEVLNSRLTRPEQVYHNGIESPDFIELAYEGGALRAFVNSNRTEVFALAVESSHSAYPQFLKLQPSNSYMIYEKSPLIVVCRVRSVNELVFERVVRKDCTLSEICGILGEPSYTAHLHGIGEEVYAFVPEGLVFQGWGGGVRLSRPNASDSQSPLNYDQYVAASQVEAEAFCRYIFVRYSKLRQVVSEGKLSPSGKYRAGMLGGGVYWDNCIVIAQQTGAEIRRYAPYFISAYDWLDDQRVIFAVSKALDTDFYTVSIEDEVPTILTSVKGRVQALSVPNSKCLLYRDGNGELCQVQL